MVGGVRHDERVAGLDWTVARAELDITLDGPVNIGWHCSDRNCAQGRARLLTYDDLRVLSNGMANFLSGAGVCPGDRVCLFLDRVPELYLAFLGILKMGATAQPLFSAFGEESLFTRLDDAGTSAIVTQRKHLAKIRKIRDRLPALAHVIVTDLPQGAMHDHGSIVSQYLTAKSALDLSPGDVYWCNAERWYGLLEKHKATVWYSAPTAIRLLTREGKELARRHDLSSLRHLSSKFSTAH